MQPALRVLVEPVGVALEILDQTSAECAPLLAAADGVDLEGHVGQAKPLPEAVDHDELLDVDIGPGET